MASQKFHQCRFSKPRFSHYPIDSFLVPQPFQEARRLVVSGSFVKDPFKGVGVCYSNSGFPSLRHLERQSVKQCLVSSNRCTLNSRLQSLWDSWSMLVDNHSRSTLSSGLDCSMEWRRSCTVVLWKSDFVSNFWTAFKTPIRILSNFCVMLIPKRLFSSSSARSSLAILECLSLSPC